MNTDKRRASFETKKQLVQRYHRRASFETKKELVQTYLIITTLLFTIINKTPNIWILAFIITILGYSVLLMYEKDGQDLFAMFTGVTFSAVIFYTMVRDIIDPKNINYPLSAYLFNTSNSSIITTASSIITTHPLDSHIYGFMAIALAMLLLGLIAALTTCTLSMDEKKSPISPLQILKNTIGRGILKMNDLLFTFSLIFILILFYKAKAIGFCTYAVAFLGADILFWVDIPYKEDIFGYDPSNIQRMIFG